MLHISSLEHLKFKLSNFELEISEFGGELTYDSVVLP